MLKQDKVLHIYGFRIVFLYLTCGEMGKKILVLGGETGEKILVLGGKLVMSTETWLRKCCEHLVTNCFITHLRKMRRTLMR